MYLYLRKTQATQSEEYFPIYLYIAVLVLKTQKRYISKIRF